MEYFVRLVTMSVRTQVLLVLVVFVFWCALSMSWYVCGVRNLCAIQAEAHSDIIRSGVVESLAITQSPLAVIYERAGSAGEIFIMLLIAFVLGGLLGRILATSGENRESKAVEKQQTPLIFHLPAASEKPQLATRVGTPSHISVFTKQTADTITTTKERPKIRFNTSWSNPYKEH